MNKLTSCILALALTAPAWATEAPESLHCTLISVVDKGEGIPAELWARGDNVRTEVTTDARKVVSLQRGNVLFTWATGELSGERRLLVGGLTSMGLIRQIEEVREYGEMTGPATVEGVEYDTYVLDRYPGERSLVYLSRDSSIPGMWVNAMEKDGRASETRMYFRDATSSDRPCRAANVAIPDKLFHIPEKIQFMMEE